MKAKNSGIGDRIRAKRKEHKLSQRELAEMTSGDMRRELQSIAILYFLQRNRRT